MALRSPAADMTVPPAGRMTARALQVAVAVAIVPIAASVIWLAITSDHLERPAETALYRTYLAVVPMLIGLYWWGDARPAGSGRCSSSSA